jgi:type I restriction enzyme M protein
MNLPGNEIWIKSWNNTVSPAKLRQLGAKSFPKGTVIFPKIGAAIATNKKRLLSCESTYDNNVMGIVPGDRILPLFLYSLLQSFDLSTWASDSQPPSMRKTVVEAHKFPLPPLEVQTEIVDEIEGYQNVINGARAVLDNYRPHIPIHPGWPVIALGEICSFKNGLNFNRDSSGQTLKIIGVSNFQNNLYAPLSGLGEVHLDTLPEDDYLVKEGDILFVRSNGNPDLVGRSIIVPRPTEPTTFSGFTIRARIIDARALPIFFAHFFKSRDFAEMIKTVGRGANIRNLSQAILNELKIPLPPLATQQAIVAEIEEEQALVTANRKLVAHFERKIQSTLARVWGEEETVAAEA